MQGRGQGRRQGRPASLIFGRKGWTQPRLAATPTDQGPQRDQTAQGSQIDHTKALSITRPFLGVPVLCVGGATCKVMHN
eukprot:352204-Chlamydomonas_euryale.AAC.2